MSLLENEESAKNNGWVEVERFLSQPLSYKSGDQTLFSTPGLTFSEKKKLWVVEVPSHCHYGVGNTILEAVRTAKRVYRFSELRIACRDSLMRAEYSVVKEMVEELASEREALLQLLPEGDRDWL